MNVEEEKESPKENYNKDKGKYKGNKEKKYTAKQTHVTSTVFIT